MVLPTGYSFHSSGAPGCSLLDLLDELCCGPLNLYDRHYMVEHDSGQIYVSWVFYVLPPAISTDKWSTGIHFSSADVAERIVYFGRHNQSISKGYNDELEKVLQGLMQYQSWKVRVSQRETPVTGQEGKTRKEDVVDFIPLKPDEVAHFHKGMPEDYADEVPAVLVLTEPYSRCKMKLSEDERRAGSVGKDPSFGISA